jgi:hypothetical protein
MLLAVGHPVRLVACAVLVGAACRPVASQAPSAKGPDEPAADATRLPTAAELAARAKDSVVVVRTNAGLGTGFVVGPSLIVTNLHVVAGATSIEVFFSRNHGLRVSSVVGIDPVHDLVLLRAEGAEKRRPLSLGDDARIRPGDSVLAIGTPEGLELTVSTGVISAVRTVNPELTLFQTTAPISPGSSGGPLFREDGRVIGVTTMFVGSGQNLNFAVPARYVMALLAHRAQPLEVAEFAKLRWGHKPDKHDQGRGGFPESVAGFSLGWTTKVAKAACPGSYREGPNRGECSQAAVPVPFASGPVSLLFSSGRLVSVSLGGTSLKEVQLALSNKYGPPDSAYEHPDPRKGQSLLLWRFREGASITVKPRPGGGVEVMYVAPVWNVEANY